MDSMEQSYFLHHLFLDEKEEEEKKKKVAFNLYRPFGRESTEDDFLKLFEIESQYMALQSYGADEIAYSQRENAIAIIRQYHKEDMTEFLAVTYLDHYLSRNPLEDQAPDSCPLKLLATACLVLALSLTSTCFKLNDFLKEAKEVMNFGNNVDVLLEIHLFGFKIMHDLKCELRAITPFCFVDYFVSLMGIEDIIHTGHTAMVKEFVRRRHFDQCTRDKPSVTAKRALQETVQKLTERKRAAQWRKEREKSISNPKPPSPPPELMDLIKNAGGMEVIKVIEKELTEWDVKKNRFSMPLNRVFERYFLTNQERVEEASLARGMENVHLLQPNLETILVTLRYSPLSFALCKTWVEVVQNAANKLAEGTRVQLWSYRVSGKLHLALIRIPEGQSHAELESLPELIAIAEDPRPSSPPELAAIKETRKPPIPPPELMDLIKNAGGVEVIKVIEKELTERDVKKNRFSMPLNRVFERYFLTNQERVEEASLARGMENVPLLQPNLEIILVTLRYSPLSFALCKTWVEVVQNAANELAEGTRVQLWSYRVSGKLHLALIRIPQGQWQAELESPPELIAIEEDPQPSSPPELAAIKETRKPPIPPPELMDLIKNAGGVEVIKVIEKELTERDVKKNRFSMPLNRVFERYFLTNQERVEEASLARGMENVPLLQPNFETILVTLRYSPLSFALCKTWVDVVQNAANELAEGTRVQLWSYRVSGKLHLALIRIPQGEE